MLSADDRLTILDLVSRADDFASARDVDGYLSLFTPDASIGGLEGAYTGADRIRAGVVEVWSREPAGTHHLSCTVSIATVDDETATANFTLLLVAGTPPTLVALVRVSQHFVRSGAGWLIAGRQIDS
jgi:hypothetical protein